jgi:hypothetical protein
LILKPYCIARNNLWELVNYGDPSEGLPHHEGEETECQLNNNKEIAGRINHEKINTYNNKYRTAVSEYQKRK